MRAVRLGTGGPIAGEVGHERLTDPRVREAVPADGCGVDAACCAEAAHWAVEVSAPNTCAPIVRRLVAPDPAAYRPIGAAVRARTPERRAFKLRAGIAELQERGLKVGLAGNQGSSLLGRPGTAGIVRYVDRREVSGTHGLEPDVRLFLRARDDPGVRPEECVMVGDRVADVVVPARLLGVRAVLLRAGRHAAQQPRSGGEPPDAEVRDVAGLRAALLAWL